MAGTVIDSLIVSLAMDATQYQKASGDATQANKRLRDDANMTAVTLEAKGKIASSFWNAQKIEILGLLGILAAGGKALADIVVGTAQASAAAGRFAQINGTTAPLVSGLQNVAKEYGSTADAANSALASIASSERDFALRGQANNQILALQHLGISTQGKDGKPVDTTTIIEEAVAKMKAMPEQQALAFGTQLGWSTDFTNAMLQAPNLPALISSQSSVTDQSASIGEKLVTAQGQLAAATSKLENQIEIGLAPAIISLINALTTIINWIDAPTTASGDLSAPVGSHYEHSKSGRGALVLVPDASESSITDAQWAAQIQQESGGRQTDQNGQPLTSSQGAVGIAQMLPSTAEDTAKKHGITWDENQFKTNAAYNGQLGRLYMNDMLSKYHGDYTEALAAYNWGPANLDADIKANGQGWFVNAPDETRGYISNIDGAAPAGAISAAPRGGLPPNVMAVLGHLRTAQASQKTTTIHAPITIDGSKSPTATGKAVKSALNGLAIQAARGLG